MAKNKVTPTLKQKKFIEEKISNPGISNYQAAIKAGYSPNTAKNAGTAIVEHSGVQTFIEKLANDDVLGQKLNEGLDSYKVDITGDKSPDFKTRLEYIREIMGIKGYKQPGVSVQINNIVMEKRKQYGI